MKYLKKMVWTIGKSLHFQSLVYEILEWLSNFCRKNLMIISINYANICWGFKLINSFRQFSQSRSRFNLRITRRTDNNLKRLIKKSLEAILEECQYQQHLPSSIHLPMDATRRSYFSSYLKPQKISNARSRCIKLQNVLPYAKRILCW